MFDKISEPQHASDAIILGVCLHSERPRTGGGYRFVNESLVAERAAAAADAPPVSMVRAKQQTLLGVPVPAVYAARAR
jgi:hypothetical protein